MRLPGWGLVAGTALLGGGAATRVGRSVARATPDIPALARTATGVAVEAIGGPSVRRTSSNSDRRWIEVRGLHDEHAAKTAAHVLTAVRATPGVRAAHLNHTLARLVVTLDPGVAGPSTAQLCRIVGDAEQRGRQRLPREKPASLPGDDAVLLGRVAAATAATVGLGLSLTGSLLRLPRLPDLLAVPPTLADHLPRLRREVDRQLGPDGADLLFGVVNATAAALTVSPTAAAAEAATCVLLAAEAWNGRMAWFRHEPELGEHPGTGAARLPSPPRMVPRNATRTGPARPASPRPRR